MLFVHESTVTGNSNWIKQERMTTYQYSDAELEAVLGVEPTEWETWSSLALQFLPDWEISGLTELKRAQPGWTIKALVQYRQKHDPTWCPPAFLFKQPISITEVKNKNASTKDIKNTVHDKQEEHLQVHEASSAASAAQVLGACSPLSTYLKNICVF